MPGIARRLAGKKPIVFMMAFCGVMMLGKMAKAQEAGVNPGEAPKPPGFGIIQPEAPNNLRVITPVQQEAPEYERYDAKGGHSIDAPQGVFVQRTGNDYAVTLDAGYLTSLTCSARTTSSYIGAIGESAVQAKCFTYKGELNLVVTCKDGNPRNSVQSGMLTKITVKCDPK